MAAGIQDIILETDTLAGFRGTMGTFERPDLAQTAHGIAGIIENVGPIDPSAIRRVYFRTKSGWSILQIFENKTILDRGVGASHLKDMIARLSGEPAVLRSLKRSAQAEYPGYETISRIEAPVRAAIDTAVRVHGSGILISGWMLDPTGIISAVTLRDTSGFSVAVDPVWTRTGRADVTQGFRSDAMMAPHLQGGHDQHGFIAYVAMDKRAEGNLYLELALANDTFAFIPVEPQAAQNSGTIRRILSAVNIHDPTAQAIVSRHIGPLLWSRGRVRIAPAAVSVQEFGPDRELVRTSVIIPVAGKRDDIDINLARLAVDPDFRNTEIVIAASPEAGERLGAEIARCAEFYGLPLRLVMAKDPIDPCDALDMGARVCETELLAFLSPTIFPTAAGWLNALENAYDEAGLPGMISPTLLYEDDSIKFAGINPPVGTGTPSNRLRSQFAGYPRHWLKNRQTAEVYAATPECCVISRAVFESVGGFSHQYVRAELKGMDFALNLRKQGFHCLWAPAVEMVALDDRRAGEPEHWIRVGTMVDQWGFDAKWSDYLNSARRHAA